MLKFTELSSEAKKVAIEGFIEDAVTFDFDWDGMDEKEVGELLSSKHEKHRYDPRGILIGKVKVYGGEEVFKESGMY